MVKKSTTEPNLKTPHINEQLALEKQRMELIYNNTREGLVLYDEKGTVVYINPSLRRLLGFKKDIIGVPRGEIAKHNRRYFRYKMERSDDSLETQKQVYSGQPVTNIMIKIFSHPVRFVEANYIPVKSHFKKVTGMIGSFRDVTLLRSQSEKIAQNLVEVEKQRNRWEAIFSNVEEGVYITDSNRRILAMNGACELMSGLTEKEAQGNPAYEIFDCHDNQGNRYPDFDTVAKVFQSLEPIPYDEHIHTNNEGSERWVGVSYTPILENERLVQCVAVVRDITALKEIEEAKTEFVSIASHELRTPLTVINGYLSLLLSGDLGDIADVSRRLQHMQVINKIYNETRRLTTLVEELLNVTRIEEGRLKLNFRKIYLSELIKEVVSEFQPIFSQQGAVLKVDIKGLEKPILGDPNKLKQVLVNLIDNAIKYNQPSVKIQVCERPFSDHVEVSVEDNGIGISRQLQSRIFSKFQQAPGSYTKENKGSGLGLFIVKSLVELHNGSIRVKSSLGKGSEFIFSLPTVATQ